MAKSYSSAGKRAEAYVLFCHARSLADTAIQKLQLANNADEVFMIFYAFLVHISYFQLCCRSGAEILFIMYLSPFLSSVTCTFYAL